MVDVGAKSVTARTAVAEGRIHMAAQTLEVIRKGSHHKGDVLAVARIAGIMAAKKTGDLVPLCHPISLDGVELEFEVLSDPPRVLCRAQVGTHDRTGVEMEALAAVQVALLTVYDMCKSVDRGMTMDGIRLLSKTGGRSGDWHRSNEG
jgi:cyclic pyranopterin phosphate synthase